MQIDGYEYSFEDNPEDILDTTIYEVGKIAESKTARKIVRDIQGNGNGQKGLQELGIFPFNKFGPRFVRHQGTWTFIELEVGERNEFIIVYQVGDWNNNDFSSLSYVSGPCLFTCGAAKAILADGSRTSLCMPGTGVTQKIVNMEIDNRLTTYEMESVCRLAKFLSLHARGTKIQSKIVNLNVPKVEYYFYLLDAFQNNLISKDQILKWFSEVDIRSDVVRQLYKKKIKKYFGGSINIEDLNLLDGAEGYVKSEIQADKHPKLSVISEIVTNTDDSGLARKVLSQKPPENFADMNFACYSLAEMIAGLDGVAVVIENPSERRIAVEASRVVKELNLPSQILGIYPMERVHERGVGNLYFSEVDSLDEPDQVRVRKHLAIQGLYRKTKIDPELNRGLY
ncbi:MAG: hypothetical protein PHW31_01915 [Candidatus Pacebacteria bacterium]|nr:hypothetical protein [Candidatus Paceibacterota bacterium]